MNKTLFQLTKALTFYIPVLFCLATFIDTTLCFLNIDVNFLHYLFGYSLSVLLYCLVNSFTFKQCVHHRIPIYYSLSVFIFNTIQYYLEPVEDITYCYVFYIGTGATILLYSYLKYKDNKKVKELNRVIEYQQRIINLLKND